MSDGWNFANLFEALAERQPDALAQRHAGVSTSWAEMDGRADGTGGSHGIHARDPTLGPLRRPSAQG